MRDKNGCQLCEYHHEHGVRRVNDYQEAEFPRVSYLNAIEIAIADGHADQQHFELVLTDLPEQDPHDKRYV